MEITQKSSLNMSGCRENSARSEIMTPFWFTYFCLKKTRFLFSFFFPIETSGWMFEFSSSKLTEKPNFSHKRSLKIGFWNLLWLQSSSAKLRKKIEMLDSISFFAYPSVTFLSLFNYNCRATVNLSWIVNARNVYVDRSNGSLLMHLVKSCQQITS